MKQELKIRKWLTTTGYTLTHNEEPTLDVLDNTVV